MHAILLKLEIGSSKSQVCGKSNGEETTVLVSLLLLHNRHHKIDFGSKSPFNPSLSGIINSFVE